MNLTDLYNKLHQAPPEFKFSLNYQEVEFFKKELTERIEMFNSQIECYTDKIVEWGSHLKKSKEKKEHYEEMLKQITEAKE